MHFIVWLFGRVREIETAKKYEREASHARICAKRLQIFDHLAHIFSLDTQNITTHRPHEMNQFIVSLIKHIIISVLEVKGIN